MSSQGKVRKQALPGGFELRNSYRIERVLGSGGFAITYLARHIGLDHLIAIKEYLPDEAGRRADDGVSVVPKFGEQDEFQWGLDRFADEARTLASFDHPAIVSVADIFECNGTAYMVMAYVEGESMETRIRRDGVIPEAALRALLVPILDALEEVHKRGILHRDIKPEHIYLNERGRPVLLDFGNSRSTLVRRAKGMTVMLTPGFAPTEQYSSQGKQGPWTDIYALGATLYQAVSGMEPPEAPDRAIDDVYVPAREMADGDYSPALLSAIDAALALRPDRRPQTIAEFRRLLNAPPAPPNTLVPVLWTDAARRNSGAQEKKSRLSVRPHNAIAAGLLTAMVIGAGYAVWSEYQQVEALRIAAEQDRKVAERAERVAAQLREVARWQRAGMRAAAEAARRTAADAARRRAVVAARLRAAEEAKREAAAVLQRKAQREALRRSAAERQLARRQTRRDAPGGPGSLLGGVRGFLQNLFPR